MGILRRLLVIAGVLALGFVVFALVALGPRNILGMLRYDQRREGNLRVGDRAPDVGLLALDGKTPLRLADAVGGKPLVLLFGSFT